MSRFASCSFGGRRFAALIEGDAARPLRGIAELGAETPAEVLADPPLEDETVPLAELTLRAVVPRPGKIVCVGLNYAAHVDEGVFEMPDYPALFPKYADALVGAGQPVLIPLGPFLVTPDEVGDPHSLDISLELNGERMQDSNTSKFIFDIPTLIATISEFVPLNPGDVVLTGTPSGVGYRRDPKVLLRDGDRMAVEVEKVGRLESPVAAER